MVSFNTPFSFHCMICYEEFHPEDRYPVVLPCGHTYVCHLCANRLDKCMECRTPLYELVPHPKNKVNMNNNINNRSSPGQRSAWSAASAARSGSRASPDRTGSPPPQPPMKRRLALPKNVVLLSLIEATELASADAQQKFTDSPKPAAASHIIDETTSIPALQTMGSIVDVEETDVVDEEEEKIKIGTSLAVMNSMAGTYAVAVKEGLHIFTSRPTEEASSVAQEEDVDTMIRVYHLDFVHAQSQDEEDNEQDKKKDPLKLSYGDRVQVVSVDGGWAKLARGYGFVAADKSQLVKVGGPVDRACKLEAMLCSLSRRRKELRKEQSRIDNEFIRFMNELQHSLHNDEDLTVILADTFSLPVAESRANFKSDEETDIEEKKEDKTSNQNNEHDDYPRKPHLERRPSTPPLVSNRTGGFACFAGGVFGDDGSSSHENAAQVIRSAFTTPGILSQFSASHDGENDHASRLFPSVSHPSPSAMRAGAQAWREQRGRRAANGNGINFRTGMSGHMALLSTHAHAHEYLVPSWSRRDNNPTPTTTTTNNGPMKMSSHTGLTMAKSVGFPQIFNSLTLPVIGTPPRREEDETQLNHTGSM